MYKLINKTYFNFDEKTMDEEDSGILIYNFDDQSRKKLPN